MNTSTIVLEDLNCKLEGRLSFYINVLTAYVPQLHKKIKHDEVRSLLYVSCSKSQAEKVKAQIEEVTII